MPLPVGDQLSRVVPDMNLSRCHLAARLDAAGLSTTAIAALLSSDVFAQDATPVPTPEATPTPEEILRGIGKDSWLIGYGSPVFGTPLELIDGLTAPIEIFFIRSNGPVFPTYGEWGRSAQKSGRPTPVPAFAGFARQPVYIVERLVRWPLSSSCRVRADTLPNSSR
jgi:hypothetical protein